MFNTSCLKTFGPSVLSSHCQARRLTTVALRRLQPGLLASLLAVCHARVCLIKADGCMQDIVCWHRWQWETKRHLGARRQVRLAPVIHPPVAGSNRTAAAAAAAAPSSSSSLVLSFVLSSFCCLVRLHSCYLNHRRTYPVSQNEF